MMKGGSHCPTLVTRSCSLSGIARCREFLAANLSADGYEVLVACSREQTLVLLCERMPDLLLVDLDGDTLALWTRSAAARASRGGSTRGCRSSFCPGARMSFTACDACSAARTTSWASRSRMSELRERVAAVLRRCGRERARVVLRAGPLTIDPAARTIDAAGRPVELSRLEFDLLRTLAAQPGRVFTREELLRDCVGLLDRGAEPNARLARRSPAREAAGCRCRAPADERAGSRLPARRRARRDSGVTEELTAGPGAPLGHTTRAGPHASGATSTARGVAVRRPRDAGPRGDRHGGPGVTQLIGRLPASTSGAVAGGGVARRRRAGRCARSPGARNVA